MNSVTREEASSLRDRVKEYWVKDVLHQQPIQNLTLNLYSEQQQCFINSYNLLPATGNLITLLAGTGMGKTVLQKTSQRATGFKPVDEWPNRALALCL